MGLTEAQARAQFSHVDIYKASFKPIKATLSGRDTRVLMKLIVDASTDRIVGCHMVGDGAAETIQVLGIAVKMKATKSRFRRHHGAASDGGGRAGDDADADVAACEGSGGVGGRANALGLFRHRSHAPWHT